jgi:hypothetical protein
MGTRPRGNGSTWVTIGLVLAAVHLAGLAAIALFDNGQLVSDWLGTSVWLVIAAIPAVLAIVGLRRRGFLIGAAIISLPLALISLAGATLPLVFPAFCYVAGYIARDPRA